VEERSKSRTLRWRVFARMADRRHARRPVDFDQMISFCDKRSESPMCSTCMVLGAAEKITAPRGALAAGITRKIIQIVDECDESDAMCDC